MSDLESGLHSCCHNFRRFVLVLVFFFVYGPLGESVNVHFSSSTGNAAVLVVIAPSLILDNRVKNLSVYLLLVVICVELLASVICLVVYAGTRSFQYIHEVGGGGGRPLEFHSIGPIKALKVFFAYTF